jgi:hypothetical protein
VVNAAGATSYLPLVSQGARRVAGAAAAYARAGGTDDATIVLPRALPLRSLPFLAQYLAQEIIAPDPPPSLWSVRDRAYRSADAAAMTHATGSGLRIDA